MKNMLKFLIVASIALSSMPATAIIELMDVIEDQKSSNVSQSTGPSFIDKIKSWFHTSQATQPQKVAPKLPAPTYAPSNPRPALTAETVRIAMEAENAKSSIASKFLQTIKNPWIQGGVALWAVLTGIGSYFAIKEYKKKKQKGMTDKDDQIAADLKNKIAFNAIVAACLSAAATLSLKALIKK